MEAQKLDPEFKAKFLTALRTGEYKQGKGALCEVCFLNEKKYCCIGVGYLVATGVDPKDTTTGYIDSTFKQSTIGVPDLLLGSGLTNPTARILAEMNDSGKSFLEIADYIEANL